MSSTFKRKAKPKAGNANTDGHGASPSMLGLSGTKAWTGGTTLTSTGLRDLDGILGGGQPLGTGVFVEEDRWTQSLAATLVRYWCAEAICQDQHLMVPTAEEEEIDGFGSFSISSSAAEEEKDEAAPSHKGPSKEEVLQFLQTLPLNLHWEKQHKRQQQQGEAAMNASAGALMETLEEEEEDEEEEAKANEEGLKIAWQYRKDVQQQRSGHDGSSSSKSSDNVYCHSYDLSKQLSSQIEQKQKPPLEELVDTSPIRCSESSKRSDGFKLYQKLLEQVQAQLKAHPRKVLRLLLYRFHPASLSIALPLLLVQIRLLQLPVVVLVTMQLWKTPNNGLVHLHRASDVVLQMEGFAARSLYPPPPEFRHLHGLLLVRKVNTWTAATAIGGGGHYADITIGKRPPANIYGLKRDRRKLHVPLLHIPPEDHTEGGGSVAGGGVRSGAGRPAKSASKSGGSGCGSAGGNSLLEF